jgi:hypothetical protein
MRCPLASRFVTSLPIAAALVALSLFACRDTVTEPEFANVNVRRQLTIVANGTTRSFVVTSDRGGISCTVAGAAATGKCTQGYKSGSIVTLYLTPGSGADPNPIFPTNCPRSSETRLACNVVMDQDQPVSIHFDPQANTMTLTVSGGAGGSGGVTSSPSGVSCTITNGAAGSTGCAGAFALNASITLTATAASGSYLKAWAGGGCDAAGTGVGKSTGVCTLVMSQARAIIVSFDRPANAALAGQWGPPFQWGTSTSALAIHANLLPNGWVMSWGRTDGGRQPVLWDAAASSFTSVSEPVDLFCSGHALLPDGRLLVAGGHSGIDDQGLRSTQIFNFATRTWTAGPAMRNGRWYPTVTALANGEMLTVSGGDTSKALNMIPEVWTPGGTTGTWRALTSAVSNIPYYPMMFVSPVDGKVFVAGPTKATGFLDTGGSGSWTVGPSSVYGFRDYGSAVMYEPGKILLVGGGGPTNTAEKIDLNAGSSWQSAGQMRVARRHTNATLLADGTVLITGGSNASGFNVKPTDDNVLAAERWSPTGGWTQLARQTHYRLYHSNALLLPDARVLSLGSGQPAASGLSDDFTAEIFSPPYLYNFDGTPASRPTISSAPSTITWGQAFAVGTPNAAGIAKITLIRLSAVTHANNMDQRLNYLPFSATGASTLSVTAPVNRNLAPPGHYMLFLLDQNGVPSVAKIVQIL